MAQGCSVRLDVKCLACPRSHIPIGDAEACCEVSLALCSMSAALSSVLDAHIGEGAGVGNRYPSEAQSSLGKGRGRQR